MSEEILYIVSDYIQLFEPLDLASIYQLTRIIVLTFLLLIFLILAYRKKPLKNDREVF